MSPFTSPVSAAALAAALSVACLLGTAPAAVAQSAASAVPALPTAITPPNSPSATLPAPKTPLLRRTSGNAAWTIQFIYADENPATAMGSTAATKPAPPPLPPGGRVVSVSVGKSGKTYREQSLWSTGKTSEKWIIENVQLQQLPGRNDVALVPKPEVEDPQSPYFDYSSTDFPEFKGMSIQNFKGTATWQNKPVYVFEWTDKGGDKRTALLDETQLPLLLVNGRNSQIYAFNPNPPSRLTAPDAFLKVLQTYKRGLQVLRRMPSPP